MLMLMLTMNDDVVMCLPVAVTIGVMILMAKQRGRSLAAQSRRRPNKKVADTSNTFSGDIFIYSGRQPINVLFYVWSVHSKVTTPPPSRAPPAPQFSFLNHFFLLALYKNLFNNRSYNISILQNISYIVRSIKVIPI